METALASLDVHAYIPAPPTKVNAGAGDLLQGQLFAYASSSVVVVVDVPRMCMQVCLQGYHQQITAVKWCARFARSSHMVV